MTGYIYKLVCPIKNKPIYVGSTTKKLPERLKTHIYKAYHGGNTRLFIYIRENNIRPTIELLEEVKYKSGDYKTVLQREEFWINSMFTEGVSILNRNMELTGEKVSFKLKSSIVREVAEYVKNNGGNIGKFFEQAAEEKLKKDKASQP